EGVALKGHVSDVLFLGHTCEVKVRCRDQDFIAFAPARRGAILEHGQPVWLSFKPEDCEVLDD
ncbi:TOBE domain-containing protein, partial [Escherichia coli]|nr:TOBE domain-containing protein [Escherichia coli]